MANYFNISKKFKFDAAHMVYEHFGKCKNLHGHTYVVEVFVNKGTIDSNSGVIIDYYHLNQIVKPLIEELDHSFMVYVNDPLQNSIGALLLNVGIKKVVKFDFQTTAENLAYYFCKKIKEEFVKNGYNVNDYTVEVCVHETENTSASYKAWVSQNEI